MIFRQLFDHETWTYTYLLADEETREALLIDPVREKVQRDLQWLKDLDLKLKFILETHVHADHVTGASALRDATGALILVGAGTGTDCADRYLKDGEEFSLGRYRIRALSTPGHTDGCMSYYVDGKVFTGDTLLIRSAGRTDFQQGSPEKLYVSVTQKLYTLPDETRVYPGHDYNGNPYSTIGEEKRLNPRIPENQTPEGLAKIMNNLNLTQPKHIAVAVPANLRCGKDA